MKSKQTKQQKRILNNQYMVQEKISSGSFGVVYLGYDMIKKMDVAIKIEKEDDDLINSLDREVGILTRLQGLIGVPKLYWFGEEDEFSVMVIELLGKDLSHYIKLNTKFELKTVLQIAFQGVNILESIHKKGVIHRDLKPENLLLGRDDQTKRALYILDYGISKFYRDSNGKNHIPFTDKKAFLGTIRYASIAAHKGHELSRKDDLESFFYVLIFLAKGALPWQNLKVNEDERSKIVGNMKAKTDLSQLCEGLPPQFITIFEYVRKLNFKSEPDYKFIVNLIRKMADNNNIEFDGIFDWNNKQQDQPKSVMHGKTSLCDLNKLDTDNKSKRMSQQILQPINEPPSPLKLASSGKFLEPPINSFQSPWRIKSNLGSFQGSFSSLKLKYIPSVFKVVEGEQNEDHKDKNDIQIEYLNDYINESNLKSEDLFNKTETIQIQQKHASSQFLELDEQIPEEFNVGQRLFQKMNRLKPLSVSMHFSQIQKFKTNFDNRCFKNTM